MPDVFEDFAGAHDLTITTTADWTVSAGGMPNGDNYVQGDGSIAATYNLDGAAFDINTLTAWTVECWVYMDVSSTGMIATLGGGTPGTVWEFGIFGSDAVTLRGYNTSSAVYTSRTTASLSQDTWHHIVALYGVGTTPTIYVDNATSSSASSAPTGTPRTADGTSILYLGTTAAGATDLPSTLWISKLAIYDRHLTTTEIGDHYLAMTVP